MTQTEKPEYPGTASILLIVGGILIILSGGLLVAVASFILPNLDYSNMTIPAHVTNIAGLISGAVAMVGSFGLLSGIIVLVSGVMLQLHPSRRRTWGILAMVFSVLSFFGLGGFIVGAILGMAGGAMALTWKPRAQPAPAY